MLEATFAEYPTHRTAPEHHEPARGAATTPFSPLDDSVRLKAFRHSTGGAPSHNLRDLVSHSHTVQATECVTSTFSHFNQIPHDFMLVLDEERLLGICSRREVGMILGSGFGRELFGKKPIREHLEPKCLTIIEGSPIVEVLSTIFSVEDPHYFNDIVLLDRSGHPVGLISVITMIRLQHRFLLALNVELEEYFKLFNTSSDLMCIFDQNGYVRKINPAGATMLGYSEREMLGHHLTEFVHPEDLTKTSGEVEQQSKCGDTVNFENRYLCKDGTVCWFSWQLFCARGEKLTYATGRNINIRKQYERELEETRKAAESANRAKSEFLSNMSHEIRTPMNAVLGLTQLLEKELLSPDQRDLVQRIRTAGHSLMGILNDILDFSKIEAGRLRIEMRSFMLPVLLEQLDSLMGSTARGKGLSLQIAAAEVTGGLMGDDLRLGQVLINLVGNAVKFTKQGEVRIIVSPVQLDELTTRLRFEVRDTGVGIAPEVLSTLFTPFTQADDSITRRFGGTGLGLSICKHLVELMGGVIAVESLEGVGSTFWFEIPFARTAAVAAKSALTPREVTPGVARLTGRRVLVVDDSEINQIVVVRALALEGAESEVASDGQQALNTLRAEPEKFDIVLMDVQMPVMDGLAATRLLRGDPPLAGLPVIALTAGVLQEERQKALDAGVDDFLPKPVDLEELVAMLLRWLPPPRVKAAATPPLATPLPLPPDRDQGEIGALSLPGLECAKGIARCGSEKLYRRLIGELLLRHGDDCDRIGRAVAADDLPEATRINHTLKGVAGNLDAATLYRIAAELEIALKECERDAIDRLLLGLAAAMEEVKGGAALFKEAPSPEVSVPVPLPEMGEISPLFEELLRLLQERRMSAQRVAYQLMGQLSSTVLAPEVALLSMAVDRLEYLDAHTMVRCLADRFTELHSDILPPAPPLPVNCSPLLPRRRQA